MMKFASLAVLSSAALVAVAHAQPYDDYAYEDVPASQPNYIQAMPVDGSYAATNGYSYDGERNWDLSVGLAAILTPEYSGAEKMETTVFPMVRGTYHVDAMSSLYIEGLEAGYRFAPTKEWEAGLAANYRGGRDSDAAVLNGMADIDGTVEVGPFFRYNFDEKTSAGVKVAFDALDEHEGYVVEADVEHKDVLPIKVAGLPGLWRYGVGAHMLYGSENYMETYYGVTTPQATASRYAYAPDAGLSEVGVKGNITYAVNKNWFVMGMAGANILLEEAADSSVVKDELQPFLMLTVGYKF